MQGHVFISSLFWLIDARGLSSRSIRRYCKERNINVTALRWVSEECLEEMVVRNIEQVPVYLRTYSVLHTMLKRNNLTKITTGLVLFALRISPNSSQYVSYVIPHPLRVFPPLSYPSRPYIASSLASTLHNLSQIVCISIHSMDIHMGDVWCREPFDISCNKVHAVVKSVSGEYQVCWEKLLPAPTRKGHMTY